MPKDITAILEIIELASGEVALRRPEDQGEPLVTIRFSAESRRFLGNARHLIAKAMIEAGLEAVQELRETREIDEGDDYANAENAEEDGIIHVLH